MTYTVCKVMFKGDERVLSSSSSAVAGEIEHDLSLIPLVDTYSAGLSIETEVVGYFTTISFCKDNPPSFVFFPFS